MTEKIDAEVVAFNKLTGKFKHFCLEWDGMAIDETCPEFESCLCFKDEPLKESD